MSYKKPANRKPETKFDLYETVTNQIIEKLEQGVIPWQKPWNSKVGAPCNIVSGKEYNGINILLLGNQSYDSKYWLTYKQCQDKGGNVKKGEKGSMVVFWQFLDKSTGKTVDTDSEATSKSKDGAVPMLRYYTVFNSNQCDGLDLKKLQEEIEQQKTEKVSEEIVPAAMIAEHYKDGPTVKYGFTRACYKTSADEINMPRREHFKTPEKFFGTLYHEMVHSTGHESRLNRRNSSEVRTFGEEEYSKEELVAEMRSSFLCAKAGIENTIDNSAAYIQSWMKALQNDKKLLVIAAGQAQKAANFITKDLDDIKLALEIDETVAPDEKTIKSSQAATISLVPISPVLDTPSKEKAETDKEDPVKSKLREFGYADEALEKVYSQLKESTKCGQISDYIKSGIIATSSDLEDMLRVSKNVGATEKKKSRCV